MSDYKFKQIIPNYHRQVLEVLVTKGRKRFEYALPFSVFKDLKIDTNNKFESMVIEKETGYQSVFFTLVDGNEGDFGVDLVLYHCDPEYEWSPINQVKRTIKEQIKSSKLSIRVLADLLDTSPSQVVRLLKENKISKQWQQLANLAHILGMNLKISLEEKKI